MLSHRTDFNKYLYSDDCPSSVMSSEQVVDVLNIISGPCPVSRGAERQRYYRMRKRFRYTESKFSQVLYEAVANSEKYLEVVSKDKLFDLFVTVHTEGGKHLGRDRLSTVLKQNYCGFSKEVIQVFLNSCSECQLQRCKKQLKSTVTKPIRTSEFASRGQVDLIDLQNTSEVNRPYNFLMVYQDHLTKFVVLRALQKKSADEVVKNLLDIFSLFGPPHILQSDNGREFKNINLATMIREKWPECKIIHGKPRHPQSQGSVERVNREIKKVLGSLMRKNNDQCWIKYVNTTQYSINTSPHSTLENKTPYRVLFGRDPVGGLESFGIPEEIAVDVTTEQEINQ